MIVVTFGCRAWDDGDFLLKVADGQESVSVMLPEVMAIRLMADLRTAEKRNRLFPMRGAERIREAARQQSLEISDDEEEGLADHDALAFAATIFGNGVEITFSCEDGAQLVFMFYQPLSDWLLNALVSYRRSWSQREEE